MALNLSKGLFFFLFIFTPLAFGTTEPWSYAVMEICTGLAVLFFFVSILKDKTTLSQTPGLVPLLTFLFYIFFQLIPLPPFMVEWLSPHTFQIHQTTHLLTDKTDWMRISVNQKATLSEFFRYSTYVMFYILTVQLLRKKEMLQATAIIIAVFGGLLAFSSILQFYLTEDMALWFRHSPINSIVVGPYANHNHYAGLMEMIFPIVLGLFLFYRPRIKNTSLIKGIAEIFSQEKANIHILIGMSALLILISIFVSLSRGAMISTCLSLIVFTFFLLKRKISKGNTMVLIGIIMVSALSIGWFGWDQIFDRFAKLKNAQGVIYESRIDFWKDTQEIIRDYPLTGTGMGTFSHTYPLYRSFKGNNVLNHAHNDYLELLAEGGFIAFLMAGSFLLTLFYKTYTVFSRRRDAFSIYVYIGCITALISLLLHSFTDFNMHIGANGLWFFFIAGIAVSAANTGIQKQSLKTRLIPEASRFKRAGLLLTLFVIIFLGMGYQASNLTGRFYYSNIKPYMMSTQTPPDILKKIDRIAGLASWFDPFNADYPYTMAHTAWFLNHPEKSGSHFISSIRLAPLNSGHLTRFGMLLAQQGKMDKADLALRKSMQYDQSNAEYTYQYAAWLFSRNKIEQGLIVAKKTLILNEAYFDRVLTVMIVSGMSHADMARVIPELPGPSIAYANFLRQTGLINEAIDRYMDTLDLIELFKDQPAADPAKHLRKVRSYYFKLYHLFKTHKDMKNAMTVMERAEKTLPKDALIKVAIGDLYYQQGILYKAADKYDHAILLDPGNKRAQKMMQKINL